MAVVEARDLKRTYGSFEALAGISFDIEPGHIVGLLGPNGAGKSTTMKILTGYLAPTGGSARVCGHDVLTEPVAVRENIGYLPESAPIYDDMTVRGFLDFVGRTRGLASAGRARAIDRVLDECALQDRVHQRVGTLSKGYRQRVGLAQALLHEPKLLILDEPTNGLDPSQIIEIRTLIRRVGETRTVILSTHILSEVQVTCDRVVIIHQGGKVADGATEDVIAATSGHRVSVGLAPGKVLITDEEVVAQLTGLSHVDHAQAVAADGDIRRFTLHASDDVRREVFRWAVARGHELVELAGERSNLEEVFLRLTDGSDPSDGAATDSVTNEVGPNVLEAAGATWVVGTAGHVDHGKTSLIRALTGVDLDTRPEERNRGITIALGFVPLDLPDGRRVAFVDVPGHERLVRTMIAGATGIDAALLCVSSQDGVMPQTREHLAILGLLGVSQGVIALTKADLVDEELLELAMEEIAEEVEGTFLEGAPIVPVSSVAGTGLDTLVQALAALQIHADESGGPFRLPVDRAFSRSGFGTVVTGTAWSGSLAVGDAVSILPSGQTARVRGLQTHGAAADSVRAGWRVAVNLSGVDLEEVPRGVVVTTGDVPSTAMLDVQLRTLATAPELDDGAPVRFLVGTAEVMGKVHLAADVDTLEPGVELMAQVRLDEPVAVLPGDRFVLRRASPMDTIGGGVVVDPWAPRLRRNRRVAHGLEATRLLAGDVRVWLERAGEVGLTAAEWRSRPGSSETLGQVLGDRRLADPIVARLEGVLIDAVNTFHVEQPLQRGAGRRELLRGRLGHLDPKVFDALVRRMVDAGALEIEGTLVRRIGFVPALDATQQTRSDSLKAAFVQAGLEGLTLKKALEVLKSADTEALIRLLEHEGALVAVPQAGWLDATALATLRTSLQTHFAGAELLEPAAFKELTGLPRRVAIPLLEWMDAQGWTRRVEGGRVVGESLQGA